MPTLAFSGDLTQARIARTTGVPLGTVKSRARRGLQRLRCSLTPFFEPCPADDGPTVRPFAGTAPTPVTEPEKNGPIRDGGGAEPQQRTTRTIDDTRGNG